MFNRMATLLVLSILRLLLAATPNRLFSDMKDRLAALWLDMMDVPVPAGGATDTSFGIVRDFDDFNHIALDTTNLWNVNTDAGGTNFAVNLQANGVVRGAVDGTDNDNTNMNGPVIYRADSGGPLICEWRVAPITSVADGENFVGMNDAITDELPIQVSTTDVQTDAGTDAVGFCYTGAGTANWKACGVDSDASRTPVVCNQGFVDATGASSRVTTPVVGRFQTLKVVINEDGDADFHINGSWQATIANAVSPDVLLNQYLAFLSGGTIRSVDVDYAYVSCGRRPAT